MAPVKNVIGVREIADEQLPFYPIVTESNGWIRVMVPDDWDAEPLVHELCRRGYRAKQLGPTVKITKDGLNWP